MLPRTGQSQAQTVERGSDGQHPAAARDRVADEEVEAGGRAAMGRRPRRDVMREEDQPAGCRDQRVDPAGETEHMLLRLPDLDRPQEGRVGRAAIDPLAAGPAAAEGAGKDGALAEGAAVVGIGEIAPARPRVDRVDDGVDDAGVGQEMLAEALARLMRLQSGGSRISM